MINIETGKSVEYSNLLAIRKKMSQVEIQQEMAAIGQFMKEHNLKKVGPIIMTSFSIESI